MMGEKKKKKKKKEKGRNPFIVLVLIHVYTYCGQKERDRKTTHLVSKSDYYWNIINNISSYRKTDPFDLSSHKIVMID